jgi:membrane-associated phospholipid phosphatase
MIWEQELLLWLHSYRTPFLDRMFLLTEPIGTVFFFTVLAIVVTAWHLVRRERREAIAWIAVSVVIFSLRFALKMSIARARPQLWPPLVHESTYAFPSGHAIGTSAFYPLLAWTVFAARSKRKWPWIVLAVLAVLVVGIGRLYMGIHWPTDVLGGWAIGFTVAAAAIAWLRRGRVIPRQVI